MRTVLDEARYWFLEDLAFSGYDVGCEVRVVVVEGLVATDPEPFTVGDHVVTNARSIDPGPASRRLLVRFPEPIAWQVVDESYTTFRKEEQRDDTSKLQVLQQSAYFDYVLAQHGWFVSSARPKPALHYRLHTENDVIDVIAREPPVVEPWVDP